MFKDGQSRKRSPSDLPEEPWVSVGPMIPPAKQSTHGGRPRAVDMRTILNTIPALNRSGGPWKMLPYNGLPKRAVYDDCAQWRDDGTWAGLVQALRERNRVEAGHEPPPQRRLHRYRCTTRLEGFRIASDYCEDPLTVSMT